TRVASDARRGKPLAGSDRATRHRDRARPPSGQRIQRRLVECTTCPCAKAYRMVRLSRQAKTFTPKQGQYLAFIHLYTRLHRRPPAETDMQQYFRVSPPSVHQMVLTLERAGFIKKQPRTARSIEVLVDPDHLPELL